MNLSRITASIALVAYLLGGWLLPAVHDHAAHGEHQACGHAHAADASEAAHSHAHPDTDRGCCPTDAPDTAPTGDLDEHNQSGRLAAQHSPVVHCDGLCVLCQISTRQFISTTDGATSYLRAGPTQRVTLVDQPLSRSLRLSIDGPRGPPARLG